MSRLGRWTAALAAVCASGLALAGCGGSDEPGGATTAAAGGPAGPASLTIAYPAFSSSHPLAYIAEHEGYFDDENLRVKILSGQGANTTTLVVSGRADLVTAGASTPLAIAAQGKQPSIVYGVAGGGTAAFMVGSTKAAKTLDQLQSLDDCRLGTFSKGSSAYGFAAYYNETLDLGCELIPFSDVPTAVAALVGGRADAVVASYGLLSPAIADGKASILIDTRLPEVRERYLRDQVFPEAIEFGIADQLEGKRDAVVRYLRALGKARTFLETRPAAEVADVLASYPQGTSSLTADQMSDTVEALRAYSPLGSDGGYVGPEVWQTALAAFARFGLDGYDPDAPGVQYDRLVDMSFLQEASGS